MMKLKLKNDDNENKIYTLVDGQECVLNFRMKDANVIEFYRTFVPMKLRNKGIAAKLVEFGLNYAHEQNKKVLPTCSYVRAYIDKHPKWSAVVEQ